MKDNRRPIDIIRELIRERVSWTDEQVIAELAALPVLPNEYLYLERHWGGPTNPAWDDPKIQDQLSLFLALSFLVADRKIQLGVPLLLERASYGDFGETMRGLHHRLTHTYEPNWTELADVCIQAAKYPQPGARLWAINLLGSLNSSKLTEIRGLSTLFEALHDPAKLVRFHACVALEWVAERYPEHKTRICKELELLVVESRETIDHAQDVLREITNNENI